MNIYIPNINLFKKRLKLLNKLILEYMSRKPNSIFIIGGDFNLKVAPIPNMKNVSRIEPTFKRPRLDKIS
jgi:hypothetical protein